MVPLDRMLAFAAAAFVITLIPGPSALFAIGRALAYGRRTALVTVGGNWLGAFTLSVAVAFGVGTLVQRSVLVFTVLKLVGAAYLVYLGVKAWRARGAGMSFEAEGRNAGGWRTARDGFLVGVSNPKTAVFLAAVLPQFAVRSNGHVPLQLMLLSMIFLLLVLVFDASWSLVASGARAWLGRSPKRLRMIGGTGGLTMIGLGLSIALTGQKD